MDYSKKTLYVMMCESLDDEHYAVMGKCKNYTEAYKVIERWIHKELTENQKAELTDPGNWISNYDFPHAGKVMYFSIKVV